MSVVEPNAARPQSRTSALAEALRACRRQLGYAALFSAVLNLLFLAPTLYMLQVYDRVVPTRGHLTLLFLTLALLVALMALSALDFARSRLLVRAGAVLDAKLAGAVLDAGLAKPRGGREVLASRAMREFDIVRQALTGPGILALFDAPWTPIYILVSFVIHPALGVLVLVGVGVLTGLTYLNDRATRLPLHNANEAASRSYLSQQYSTASADLIRALGMRQAMVRRHLGERRTTNGLQLHANLSAGGIAAVSRFVRLALQSLALGLGAYLAIEQKISGGAVFAASLLAGRALAPVEQLLTAWRSIDQARDAYGNLKELLPAQKAEGPIMQLPPPTGAFNVEQLVVFNPGGETPILRGLTFAVGAGEIIGLIGPNGAGKSTLARILAGAAMPDRGVVRFDGANAADWDRERLARSIGYMPQDTTLFEGSIKENIARFRNHLADAPADLDQQVIDAATLAGAHAMILRLPGGYDTRLAWGGSGLSAGHAQRIALARALFGSPRLVILDEPNAHLDSEGDAILAGALGELKKRGVTVVVVAHRVVLGPVDRLLLLHDGQVAMFGPRDEVIQRLNTNPGERAVVRPAAAV